MTYGYWLGRAHDRLVAARADVPAELAVDQEDVAAALVAHRRIYHGLARLVEVLSGGRPARGDLDRHTAGIALQRANAPRPARLYAGLRAAARAEGSYPDAATPACRVSVHLAAAADAVGVAADILASHAPPGSRPVTPEGVAIRAGAGVRAGMATIAQLAHGILLIDMSLPAWVTASSPGLVQPHRQAISAARWASNSRLPGLAREMVADGDRQPQLLHQLPIAPATGRATPTIDIAHAATGLTRARDWLYRNPDQVRAAHLAAAVRLGLAVSVIARPGTPGAHTNAWHAAATCLPDLSGSPPAAETRDIVLDLDALARWVRGQDRHTQQPIPRRHRDAVDRLAAGLPALAEVLRGAVGEAARRGDLFVAGPVELAPTTRRLVHYAITTWKVADERDAPLPQLRLSLAQACARPAVTAPPPVPPAASRLAKLAFLPLTVVTHPANRPSSTDERDNGGHEAHRDARRRGR
jgi:hypothetical protein